MASETTVTIPSELKSMNQRNAKKKNAIKNMTTAYVDPL